MSTPTLGRYNIGIAISEAPDEAAARKLMDEDPAITEGFATGELRPFRVSLMRGVTDDEGLPCVAGRDPSPQVGSSSWIRPMTLPSGSLNQAAPPAGR